MMVSTSPDLDNREEEDRRDSGKVLPDGPLDLYHLAWRRQALREANEGGLPEDPPAPRYFEDYLFQEGRIGEALRNSVADTRYRFGESFDDYLRCTRFPRD